MADPASQPPAGPAQVNVAPARVPAAAGAQQRFALAAFALAIACLAFMLVALLLQPAWAHPVLLVLGGGSTGPVVVTATPEQGIPTGGSGGSGGGGGGLPGPTATGTAGVGVEGTA